MKRPIFFILVSIAGHLALVLSLTSCTIDTVSNEATAPEVELTCYSGDGCKAGMKAYVGIKSTSFNCYDELSKLIPNHFEMSFDISTSGDMTFTGTLAKVTLNQWIDANQASTLSISGSQFQICAFIDIDNNGQFNGIDLYHSGTWSSSETQIYIEDWM